MNALETLEIQIPNEKMDSNAPRLTEDASNTETDEETIALRKKRSRRVSFADREITSVHIFNRDEDYETPPEDSRPADEDPENEVLGFFRDLADSDESKDASLSGGEGDEGDEEVVSSRKSFLRPIGSPSPGSSICASATSNDEDNFFGPVSANFIRPGRLSDSAVSDDNHDITMDSTAFSMHFRSLVRSESGGDLKTPTTATLAFEENAATPVSRGLMEFTNPSEETPRFPVPIKKLTGSRDSNDMSLVGGNPPSYDYARLSPTVEALLAQGDNELPLVDVLDLTNPKLLKSEVPLVDTNGSGSIVRLVGSDKVRGDVVTVEKSMEGEFTSFLKSDQVNGVSSTISIDLDSGEFPPDLISKAGAYGDIHIQSPCQLSKVQISAQPSEERISNRPTQVSIDASPNKGTQGNLDGFMHYEFQQHSISPRYRREIFDIKKFDEQQTPSRGSISSLAAKQRQIILNADNVYKHLSYATPSRKQPIGLLSEESRSGSEAAFAILRNNSSLPVFEPSPLASALKDGIERSKKRLSELQLSATSLVNASVDKNKKGSKGVNMRLPVINLEKHLLSLDPSSMNLEIKSHKDGDGCTSGSSIRGNGGSSSSSEGVTGLVKDGPSLDHMLTYTNPREMTSHLMTDVAPLHQFNLLQEEGRQQQLIPEKSADGNHDIRGTDSSSGEMDIDHRVFAPFHCVSSSLENVGKVSSPVAEHQDTSLHDLRQQVPNEEHFSIGSGQEGNTALASFHTPLGEKNINNFSSGGPDYSSLIVMHSTYSPKELALEGEFRSPSMKDDNRRRTEASPRKDAQRKELVKCIIQNKISRSPTKKESCNALDNGKVEHFVGEHIISSSFSCSGNNIDDNLEFQKLDGPRHLQKLESIPGQKRRIEELSVGNSEHANKISRICVEPNINTSQSSREFVTQCSNGGNKGEEIVECEPAIKHWTDFVLKFSAGSGVLLSPLVDKLNERAISLLQDIMENLKKVTMSQILCSQIQSQGAYDHAIEVRQKRVGEMRLLLCKLAYDKAKHQLISMKHEKLLKRSHKLRSAIEETQMLKTNLHQSLHEFGGIKSRADDNAESSSIVCKEGSSERVVTLRHELEVSKKKVETLTKFFQSCSKSKEELSCHEVILLLKDHLRKRTTCRLIRGYLQLWEIDHLSSWGGQHNVVLKCQGLFQQRFTIGRASAPDIRISIELNDAEITKNFPNMDAHMAFAFVLNTESIKKNTVSGSLAQWMQITNSCLQNLLDVLEEVQHAQIECRNLIQTSFSSTVEQLDLWLSFYDFKSGAKVLLALDMTCLKSGVYPSEVLPYKLQYLPAITCKSRPESLLTEIRAAFDSLTSGYSRILKLCYCVSKAMESSCS